MATQNSWNNTINSATTVTLNGATVNVGSDASASTINLATGADVKTVTLGSTNSTSKLDLKYGTADFTLASATGTVMSALDTGEITRPLQPAFLATLDTSALNVTGDTSAYTPIFNVEVYDQNADYNNATGVFTAPVTGRYFFTFCINAVQIASNHLTGISSFVTSNRNLSSNVCSPYASASGGTDFTFYGCTSSDMDAADTCYVSFTVGGGSKVIDANGDVTKTYFSGHLIC